MLMRGTAVAAVVLVAASSACGGEETRPMRFVDATMPAGLVHEHTSTRLSFACPFEEAEGTCGPSITGGAAAGDFDGDGWVDLFVTRWDAPPALYRNRGAAGPGTFVDVAHAVGLTAPLRASGAAWGDVDGDGDLDLYVTTVGARAFHLFVNHDGRFVDEAAARGVAADGDEATFGFSAVFADYDRDGWLDLYTTEWRRYVGGDGPRLGRARLFRNRGVDAPGFFVDVTSAAGVGVARTTFEPAWEVRSFSAALADVDDDGHMDLLVAGDFGSSRLLFSNGDGTFTDGTTAAGVAREENGMGSAVADVDGDGRLDWFVTSIHDPELVGSLGNRLYRNLGARRMEDVTEAAGVKAGFWGWAASVFDPDLDGDLDLVMTNGFDRGAVDTRWLGDPMRLWGNDGSGRFVERSTDAGLVDTGDGKGLVVFDPDRDGDEDLFVVNAHGRSTYWRNEGTPGEDRFLRVELAADGGNRFGIGARLELERSDGTRLVRTIGAANNYLGQNEPVALFAIGGRAEPTRLRIIWPDGPQETMPAQGRRGLWRIQR